MTVVLTLFVTASLVLVVVDPTVASRLAGTVGLGPAAAWPWSGLRWPIMIAGAIVAMLWFYVASLAMLIGAELDGVLDGQRP